MSATCVPWYMLRGTRGLSKHGNPVCPLFCPLNLNLARVRTSEGGGGVARVAWEPSAPIRQSQLPHTRYALVQDARGVRVKRPKRNQRERAPVALSDCFELCVTAPNGALLDKWDNVCRGSAA